MNRRPVLAYAAPIAKLALHFKGMATEENIVVGEWVLEPASRKLFIQGRSVKIGDRSFSLLLVLVRRIGCPVDKYELLALVWPERRVDESALRFHVAVLRRLLGRAALATRPGRGYQLMPASTGAEVLPGQLEVVGTIPADSFSIAAASAAELNAEQRQWRFGRVLIRPTRRQVLIDNLPIAIGPHAFDLLIALVERAGHPVSADQLLRIVWPGRVVERNNLQVHVWTLRLLLGRQAIATIPGQGYQFAMISDQNTAIRGND